MSRHRESFTIHSGNQLKDGLLFLHTNGVHHYDISPKNIIVTTAIFQNNTLIPNSVCLKYTDLSFSQSIEPGQQSLISNPAGTPAFSAPEITSSKDSEPTGLFTVACDIYSYGSVLYFMYFGFSSTLSKTHKRTYAKIISILKTDRQGDLITISNPRATPNEKKSANNETK